jgi:hypothetical protein
MYSIYFGSGFYVIHYDLAFPFLLVVFFLVRPESEYSFLLSGQGTCQLLGVIQIHFFGKWVVLTVFIII